MPSPAASARLSVPQVHAAIAVQDQVEAGARAPLVLAFQAPQYWPR